jgi:hypothetical protein
MKVEPVDVEVLEFEEEDVVPELLLTGVVTADIGIVSLPKIKRRQ